MAMAERFRELHRPGSPLLMPNVWDVGSAKVIHIVDGPEVVASHVAPAVTPVGDLSAVLEGMAATGGPVADHEAWIAKLRDDEQAARAGEQALLSADAEPIHPARVYSELRAVLDRDAVVIGDGGDFVSWAGRLVES